MENKKIKQIKVGDVNYDLEAQPIAYIGALNKLMTPGIYCVGLEMDGTDGTFNAPAFKSTSSDSGTSLVITVTKNTTPSQGSKEEAYHTMTYNGHLYHRLVIENSNLDYWTAISKLSDAASKSKGNTFTGLNIFTSGTYFGDVNKSASTSIATYGGIEFYKGAFSCGKLITDNANDKNLTYRYGDAIVKFPKKSGILATNNDIPTNLDLSISGVLSTTGQTVTVTSTQLSALRDASSIIKTITLKVNTASSGSDYAAKYVLYKSGIGIYSGTSGFGFRYTGKDENNNTIELYNVQQDDDNVTVRLIPNSSSGSSGNVTLAGNNTFTGNNTFNKHIRLAYGPEGYVDFGNNVKFYGYYWSKNGYSLSVPTLTQNETVALKSEIPNTSNFATLSAANTFTGINTFTSPNNKFNGITLNSGNDSVNLDAQGFTTIIGQRIRNFVYPTDKPDGSVSTIATTDDIKIKSASLSGTTLTLTI